VMIGKTEGQEKLKKLIEEKEKIEDRESLF
jgi:hypothetical protein